ncbi:uncharacterized protein TRIADDRAFT_54138 [Trichoplax adhaerens]|uniref:HP domain-containing protein n=1 Tax=Trichoplax adhaerens TaxID=10228 RepID=B3RR78_TRIAD|nr:hypothetical protein TRIADDRAFT_54138 [Trichoplax adhaerens]EDV26297.1 hypothetical protein TRIADDRAFT_54138 [Trichoplax adhaerens]|eukprot:XP_002110293.1 hypothetical protein TRIADDRAFT_54138 [Trichoplax adhaerens]
MATYSLYFQIESICYSCRHVGLQAISPTVMSVATPVEKVSEENYPLQKEAAVENNLNSKKKITRFDKKPILKSRKSLPAFRLQDSSENWDSTTDNNNNNNNQSKISRLFNVTLKSPTDRNKSNHHQDHSIGSKKEFRRQVAHVRDNLNRHELSTKHSNITAPRTSHGVEKENPQQLQEALQKRSQLRSTKSNHLLDQDNKRRKLSQIKAKLATTFTELEMELEKQGDDIDAEVFTDYPADSSQSSKSNIAQGSSRKSSDMIPGESQELVTRKLSLKSVGSIADANNDRKLSKPDTSGAEFLHIKSSLRTASKRSAAKNDNEPEKDEHQVLAQRKLSLKNTSRGLAQISESDKKTGNEALPFLQMKNLLKSTGRGKHIITEAGDDNTNNDTKVVKATRTESDKEELVPALMQTKSLLKRKENKLEDVNAENNAKSAEALAFLQAKALLRGTGKRVVDEETPKTEPVSSDGDAFLQIKSQLRGTGRRIVEEENEKENVDSPSPENDGLLQVKSQLRGTGRRTSEEDKVENIDPPSPESDALLEIKSQHRGTGKLTMDKKPAKEESTFPQSNISHQPRKISSVTVQPVAQKINDNKKSTSEPIVSKVAPTSAKTEKMKAQERKLSSEAEDIKSELISLKSQLRKTDNKFAEEVSQIKEQETIKEAVDDVDSELRYKNFATSRRAVRPNRRQRTSANPLKSLQNRSDLLEDEEAAGKRATATSGESLSTRIRLPKNQQFAPAAVAGLAADLDFTSVSLRKQEDIPPPCYPDVILLHIKGRRNVQCRFVEPISSSINIGDAFILITQQDIFLLLGDKVNVIEKNKAAEIATLIIQQKDYNCKASRPIIYDNVKDCDFNGVNTDKFWEYLGGKQPFTPLDSALSDEEFEQGIDAINQIFVVQCNPTETLVELDDCSGKPLRVSLLDSKNVYVLDFGSEVYVWAGRFAETDARRAGNRLGQEMFDKEYQFAGPINPLLPISIDNYDEDEKKVSTARPPWGFFQILKERTETSAFREKFFDWPEPGLSDNSRTLKMTYFEEKTVKKKKPSIPSELTVYDAKNMIKNEIEEPSTILEGQDIGRGEGVPCKAGEPGNEVEHLSVKIWIVSGRVHEALDPKEYGEFYSGETYVICWRYRVTVIYGKRRRAQHKTGRDRTVYFYWHGSDCSIGDKGTSALLTVELDDEKAPQIPLEQGNEPPCFFLLFSGKAVFHIGRRNKAMSPGIADDKTCRMFRIQNETLNETCLVEILPRTTSLRSRSCLIIVVPGKILYVWNGLKASEAIRKMAKHAAESFLSRLEDVAESQEIEEGDETKAFWTILGGRDDYGSLSWSDKSYNFRPRLFAMNSKTGYFIADEILSPTRVPKEPYPFPFVQSDIYSAEQPAIFLVDAYHEVYLWLGWWRIVDGEESVARIGAADVRWIKNKKLAIETAYNYCQALKRDMSAAMIVLAGYEPIAFQAIFPEWDVDMDARKANMKEFRSVYSNKRVLIQDEMKKLLTKTIYSLELLRTNLPDDVEREKMEEYLSDEDFQIAIKMSRSDFAALPKWKKLQIKKQAGLF